MKEGLTRIKAKASEGLHRWEERSRDLITNFMGLFGRDGRIVSYILHVLFLQLMTLNSMKLVATISHGMVVKLNVMELL